MNCSYVQVLKETEIYFILLYFLITVSDWQGEKVQRGVHFREGKLVIELACYTVKHRAKN